MTRAAPSEVRASYDEILDHALVSVPYNSAAQILEYFADEVVPHRLGMSCAFQAFFVGAELTRRCGATPAYFRDGRHRAAVLFEGEQLTVLDPYLLHMSPLRAVRSDTDGDGAVKAAVDAYPIRKAKDGRPVPARVVLKWDVASMALRLTYSRYSPRRDHFTVARTFRVVQDHGLTTVPPPPEQVRERLLHPEQNNLSVRTVNQETREVSEVALPLRGLTAVNRDSPQQLVSRDNQGALARFGSAEFDRDVEMVATAVGSDPKVLLEFLLAATETYLSAAPPTDDLKPYSLEDE